VFDSARADPFLMKAGDEVSFYQIDRAEFDRMDRAAQTAAA
jgi:allophanate hydrolase subunit 1